MSHNVIIALVRDADGFADGGLRHAEDGAALAKPLSGEDVDGSVGHKSFFLASPPAGLISSVCLAPIGDPGAEHQDDGVW